MRKIDKHFSISPNLDNKIKMSIKKSKRSYSDELNFIINEYFKEKEELEKILISLNSDMKFVARKMNIDFKIDLLYQAEDNIKIGTKYYKTLYDKYKNNAVALMAYNAGSGNVDRWIQEGTIKPDGTDAENIPYKETNNYVRKILRDYEIYKELYAE